MSRWCRCAQGSHAQGMSKVRGSTVVRAPLVSLIFSMPEKSEHLSLATPHTCRAHKVSSLSLDLVYMCV